MDSLMSVTEIESVLSNLATTYPRQCSLVTLPNETIEHRICHALQIGLPNAADNPAALIIAGVHAREWGGPDIVLQFATDLLAAYAGNNGLEYGGVEIAGVHQVGMRFEADEIKAIVDKTTIVIFPCVNPDGVEYSHNTNMLWRKNRNRASFDSDPATVGVDINRNFDFLWDLKKYFHPDALADKHLGTTHPADDTFHGTAPFSEPETRNVKWLMDTYPGLSVFLDLHSYGADVLYGWGDADNQSTTPSMNFQNPAYDGQRGHGAFGYGEYIEHSDNLTAGAIGSAIRDAIDSARFRREAIDRPGNLPNPSGPPQHRDYVAKPANALYPTSGTSTDYAFSRHIAQRGLGKIFGITVEFNFDYARPQSSGKDPFFMTADPQVLQQTKIDVVPGLIAFCQQAGKRIALPPLVVPPQSDRHIYADGVTGEVWYFGEDGKVHTTGPIPDRYSSKIANDLDRLVRAHESLLSVHGPAGETARAGLLSSIEQAAALAKAKPG